MKLIRCKHEYWEFFKMFHYDPNVFNTSAQCFFVEVNKKKIGFVASLAMRSGTLTNAWRAHKTVIMLSAEHPEYKNLWKMAADEQARHHVSEGKRFFSAAPIDHAAYREQPNSGWKPTTKNERRKALKRECSHEFIGVNAQ